MLTFARLMLVVLFLAPFAASLTGCSVTTSAIGYDVARQERFRGHVTMSFWDGTGRVRVKGETSGVVADGVALYGYGSGANRGGSVRLQASDGRLIKGEWLTRSMTSGVGSAHDAKGDEFVFAFGFDEADTVAFFVEQESRPASSRTPRSPATEPGGMISGTGFAVGSGSVIVTCAHVVAGAKSITIVLANGALVDGVLVVADEDDDLALIRIAGALPPLALARDADLEKGVSVATIGFPLTEVQGIEAKATFGHINAVSGVGGDPRFLQIDCPIQPGNSGGPLLVADCRVGGVVSRRLSDLATLRAARVVPQNVGYAVKAGRLEQLLTTQGEGPWLGGAKQPMEKSELVRNAEPSVVRILVTR